MKLITRWGIGILLIVVLAIIVGTLVAGSRKTAVPPPNGTTTPGMSTSTPTSTPPSTTTPPLSARVSVTTPPRGGTVGNTFIVAGEAPGNWYFEASFPIQVRSKAGDILGRAVAQAQSDWMTTAQVPFAATVTLESTYTGPAILILMRDNPSGLPENDDSVEIPIFIR